MERHLLDGGDAEVLRRGRIPERGDQTARVLHSLRIRIDGEHFAAFAHQVDQVPSKPCASVLPREEPGL